MVYDKALIESARPEGAGLDMTLERDRRSRRRDHQGREERRLFRHAGRRRQRAGSRESGCASAARRSTPPTASSASTRRTSPSGSRFWADLRKRGASRAPEVQALDKGEIETSLLTLGKAAMVFANSNQLVGFQAVNKSKLGMAMYPTGGQGAKPGQYLKPSMLLERLGAGEAARGGGEAGRLLRLRSRSRRAARRRARRARLGRGAQRRRADPRRARQGDGRSTSPSSATRSATCRLPPPQGAGEIQVLLRRVNEQVGFGRLSDAEGAKQFVAEANAMLARG